MAYLYSSLTTFFAKQIDHKVFTICRLQFFNYSPDYNLHYYFSTNSPCTFVFAFLVRSTIVGSGRPKPDIIGWGETKTSTSWRKSYTIKPCMPEALGTIFTPFQCDGFLAATCRLYEISLLHNSGTWTLPSPNCITFQLIAAA